MSANTIAAQDWAGSRGRAIAFGFASLVRAWLERRAHRIAFGRLVLMSDRQLKDVGIARDQIQTAAAGERASIDHSLTSM